MTLSLRNICLILILCAIGSINCMEPHTTSMDASLKLIDACNLQSQTYSYLKEHSDAIQQAIEMGAPLNGITTEQGDLASPVLFAALAGDPHLMEWLLARGASLTTSSTAYPSPFYALFNIHASLSNREQRLKAAIEHFKTKLPFTQEAIILEQLSHANPLIKAALSGNEQLIKRCLEYGLNPNTQDARGRTALMYAVENKAYTIIRALLEYGVDVSVTDREARTAIDYAGKGFDEQLKQVITTFPAYTHTKVPLQHTTGSKEDIKIAVELSQLNAAKMQGHPILIANKSVTEVRKSERIKRELIHEVEEEPLPKQTAPRQTVRKPAAPQMVIQAHTEFIRPQLESPTKRSRTKKKN